MSVLPLILLRRAVLEYNTHISDQHCHYCLFQNPTVVWYAPISSDIFVLTEHPIGRLFYTNIDNLYWYCIIIGIVLELVF